MKQSCTAVWLGAALLPCTALAQSPAGSWELYPAPATVYTASVQQPINADGTSNFKSTGKAVIPVKFSLATSPGPVVFQSILSDGSDPNPATTNDYSYLSFTPAAPLLFSQVTNLSAVYTFSEGNCHGGALRWSVRVSPVQSVFIYYGAHPNFTDCTTSDGGISSQSGLNVIGRPDLRYDTSQVGGTFYDSYANALALVGSMPIVRASLVLDGGWAGDQVLAPTNVTFNGNTFVPASGGTTPTCNLPPATIQIIKVSGTPTGPVNEPLTVQPADDNAQFRIVDCKYMYNLDTGSLSGAGRYKVEVVINGTPAAGAASFDLR
jgi:hypothetical protein